MGIDISVGVGYGVIFSSNDLEDFGIEEPFDLPGYFHPLDDGEKYFAGKIYAESDSMRWEPLDFMYPLDPDNLRLDRLNQMEEYIKSDLPKDFVKSLGRSHWQIWTYTRYS